MYSRSEAKQFIADTCGEGWLPLVDKIYDNLPPNFEVCEIFQKYGALEVCTEPYQYDNEEFAQFLSDLNYESGTICQTCGEIGAIHIVDGWMTALCLPHFIKECRRIPDPTYAHLINQEMAATMKSQGLPVPYDKDGA